MMLDKRLEYGFSGYRSPAVPRASRSARVKGTSNKKSEDIQTHAFEILASVAEGKIKGDYNGGSTSHDAPDIPQMNYPLKKRRIFREMSFTSDGDTCSEGTLDSSGQKVDANYCVSATDLPTSGRGRQAPLEIKDCNGRKACVKLSIKSFKVPELFIEVPSTATVGSLKRRVVEAVSATLGDGLHVGILLQGKKVKDDSKTLLQSGISQDNKLHSLGFILEPGHSQIRPISCSESPRFSSGCGSTSWMLTRRSGTSISHRKISKRPQGCELMLSSCTARNKSATLSVGNGSTQNIMSKSRAMVPVPTLGMEALAMVPYHKKPGRPEFVQRRIRRPFTVAEVEALVQTVEKLGTGRWRDVKLCAFDSVKHRTYVDLKDKWKTLVHTAKISPQQRRGEPVPQELLDRVLAAHAFWSEKQTKQQGKSVV